MNPTSTSNSQNYNRFSYVLNNPLKYTDPSGYNYSSNNADGGTNYYIDGMKISGTMLDLLFKNNDFLSNIYRFDYVRGSTDRNARNFSITIKNGSKFGSVNRAIGISIDWSETEKLSKEIEEQFHKFYKENDPSYTGEISIPQFHQLRQSAFFEFFELNNLIQEARRGRSNGIKEGDNWEKDMPKIINQGKEILIVETHSKTYTNILDKKLYSDYKNVTNKDLKIKYYNPAPNNVFAIAFINAFGSACSPIIEEFPYLGFLRPDLIGVTFTNSRAKAIKDLQERRLKLYLSSGKILNFSD